MALISSLIHESTTTTGTGNVTVAAISARQRFSEGWSTGGTNVFYYAILHRAADEWEYGTGHLSATSTLVRDTVIASSNANALVNFSAGTKDVLNDMPAEYQLGGTAPANLATTASSYTVTIDTDGTPLAALSLAGGGHQFLMGSDYGSLELRRVTNTEGGAGLSFFLETASLEAGDLIGYIIGGGTGINGATNGPGIDFTIVDDSPLNTLLRFWIDSAGSRLAALTLGETAGFVDDFGSAYGHVFDFGTVNFPVFILQNSSTGDSGPQIHTFHNSSDPDAGDVLGGWSAYGRDSAGNVQSYGGITQVLVDPTSTSEDSSILFDVLSGGAGITALSLGTVSNSLGGAGSEFKLQATNYPALLISTTNTGPGGPGLQLYHNSANPADGDEIGWVSFDGESDTGAAVQYGAISSFATDVSNGTEDSYLEFRVKSSGADLTALTLGTTNINSVYGHRLNLGSTNAAYLEVTNTSTGTLGPSLLLYHNSASPAANDYVGQVLFWGEDSAGNAQEYGSVSHKILTTTSGAEDGRTEFWVMDGGVASLRASVDGDGIKFNTDTAAANALDDYEEGTFNPTLTTNGVNFTSVTYDTARGGRYTKIGNQVHVQGVVFTDSVTVGSATGTVCIGGLPFTAVGHTGSTQDGHAPISFAQTALFAGEEPSEGFVGENSTTILLYYKNAADGDSNSSIVSDVATGANTNLVRFAGTYIAA